MKRAVVALGLVAAIFATGSAALADAKPGALEVPLFVQYGRAIPTVDGLVDWTIPPGAYTDDLTAKYTPMYKADFPQPPFNSDWAADPFSVRLVCTPTSHGMPYTVNSLVPMTIVVHYNPADLGGRSESTLRIVRSQGIGSVWVDLPSTIDMARHTVTAQSTFSGD